MVIWKYILADYWSVAPVWIFCSSVSAISRAKHGKNLSGDKNPQSLRPGIRSKLVFSGKKRLHCLPLFQLSLASEGRASCYYHISWKITWVCSSFIFAVLFRNWEAHADLLGFWHWQVLAVVHTPLLSIFLQWPRLPNSSFKFISEIRLERRKKNCRSLFLFNFKKY